MWKKKQIVRKKEEEEERKKERKKSQERNKLGVNRLLTRHVVVTDDVPCRINITNFLDL